MTERGEEGVKAGEVQLIYAYPELLDKSLQNSDCYILYSFVLIRYIFLSIFDRIFQEWLEILL